MGVYPYKNGVQIIKRIANKSGNYISGYIQSNDFDGLYTEDGKLVYPEFRPGEAAVISSVVMSPTFSTEKKIFFNDLPKGKYYFETDTLSNWKVCYFKNVRFEKTRYEFEIK